PHCRTVVIPLFQSDEVQAWDDPQAIADAVPPNFGNIERLPLPTPVSASPKARPSQLSEPDFPATPDELTEVRTLGGTTEARLMRDTQGNLWVWKEGADSEHAMLEHAAHTLYRAFGVDAPASRLYRRDDGTVILLSEYLDGRQFRELTGEARERAATRFREGLLIDALLGNYDALGLDEDNVIVDARGRVWRVDNGGSFWRRAQGGRKAYEPADWDALWTLRGQRNAEGQTYSTPYTALMRSVGLDELRRQFQRYESRWDAVERALSGLPPEVQQPLGATLRQRWESLRETMRFADNMREAFKETYSDRVVFWYQKIQQSVGEAEREMFRAERTRWKEQTRALLERSREGFRASGIEGVSNWVLNYNLGLARQASTPVEGIYRWQGAVWQRYGSVMERARVMINRHGIGTGDPQAVRLSHLVQEVREGVPATRFFQHAPLDSPLTDEERESVAALHAFTQVQLRAILQSDTLWIWRILHPEEVASRTSLGDLSTNAVYPRLFSHYPDSLIRLSHARVPTSQVLSFWGTLHWESARTDLYGIVSEFEFTVAGAVDFKPVVGESASEKVETWLNQLSSETRKLFGD
ncbi:MAG: hypothetical protein N2651_00965, partial [Fimbriimonadales bacterium]|nr:hypothetical protein [Fimbriimonadales bacterium]